MTQAGEDQTFEVAVPYCAAEDMGDEVVALNVDTGIYFSMRGLAAVLWRDLEAGHTVESLLMQIEDVVGADLGAKIFTEQLLDYGLMRRAERVPVDSRPTIIAALVSDKSEVILEVFDDMKDLILSDPIHDVDETEGWPTRAAHKKDTSGGDVTE